MKRGFNHSKTDNYAVFTVSKVILNERLFFTKFIRCLTKEFFELAEEVTR